MKQRIIEWLLIILLVVGIVTISYSIGYSIINDYRNNGLTSVIMSFVIGIPLIYVIAIIQRRILFRQK